MYGEKEYWEGRYKNLGVECSYDYIVSFDLLFNVISELNISQESKILVVGCGNSTFSDELYDYGFENIHNIDFSNFLILNMKEKNKHKRPKMNCK